MGTMIGIYQISIAKNADSKAFEAFMKTEIFSRVGVGKQTRGGIVTGQQLLRNDSPGSEQSYSWIVRWENQGGSPFGSENAPPDPAPHLGAYGGKTSFTLYALQAEESQ